MDRRRALNGGEANILWIGAANSCGHTEMTLAINYVAKYDHLSLSNDLSD
jgi:hypothetical protein